jgi:hypothetical protein
MIRFPVTSKFETDKFAKVATPGTYKFASVASGPVTFNEPFTTVVDKLDTP